MLQKGPILLGLEEQILSNLHIIRVKVAKNQSVAEKLTFSSMFFQFSSLLCCDDFSMSNLYLLGS